MKIPYGHQWLDERDIKAVVEVLRGDWITQGPTIKRFEEALCRKTGARYAVAVANGTAALHLSCLVAGIGNGDEAITSPLTFLASANCILYCSGKPVFADIDSHTFCLDPKELLKKITSKTKAFIPVHFAGLPGPLEEFRRIADKKGLIIIEDAAHALGAEYQGTKIGDCRYSDMTIFSFHPVKAITTGEGGAVLTNNKEYYEKLLLLRNHGIAAEELEKKNEGPWYYEMQLLGYNYRMTDVQAALGNSQLKKLNKFIEIRNKISSMYDLFFRDNPYFDLPPRLKGVKSAFHLYQIRLKDQFVPFRAGLVRKLRDSGIGAHVHYIPVYFHPYYRKLGYQKQLCPQAEDFYKRVISLPIFPAMKTKEVRAVIKILLSIFRRLDK